MNTLIILFVVINTLASAVTCWYALCGLNACTRRTPRAVRLSFYAIAVGSFANMVHPPDLDIGGIGAVLMLAGIAVGFVANRRQCVCLNCPARAPSSIFWAATAPIGRSAIPSAVRPSFPEAKGDPNRSSASVAIAPNWPSS